MSRRKKRPNRHSSAKKDVTRTAANGPGETNAADNRTSANRAEDALTVGWMLTTMATLVTELGAYAGWVYFAMTANVREQTSEFLALPNMLHFSALVTGCLGLILAGIAYRVRSVPAPQSVTMIAIALCLLPMMTTLFQAAR